ncbi:hypothetical protein V6N13_034395 [Hibiscus sabdariffa]|uniref:Uncharacterized protein n=1 Tax=Hibiscus sabdariffa TaxID=183260 RepID=A0ABR2P3E4_9ROSI
MLTDVCNPPSEIIAPQVSEPLLFALKCLDCNVAIDNKYHDTIETTEKTSHVVSAVSTKSNQPSSRRTSGSHRRHPFPQMMAVRSVVFMMLLFLIRNHVMGSITPLPRLNVSTQEPIIWMQQKNKTMTLEMAEAAKEPLPEHWGPYVGIVKGLGTLRKFTPLSAL